MDLTCQGCTYYETPNIDRLASEGGHPFNDLVMMRTPANRWESRKTSVMRRAERKRLKELTD